MSNDYIGKLIGFGPYLNSEKIAPAFQLPMAQGGEIKSWSYKQRQPLVIYFLPVPDEEFLRQLERDYPAYAEAGAQLLVVVIHWLTGLVELNKGLGGLSYPLLSDDQARAYRRFLKLLGITNPDSNLPTAVFIAERFGAISRYALADQARHLPFANEILNMLEFLGNLCNP